MADTLRKALIDRVCSIVETWVDARPVLAALLRPANRTRASEVGWLRQRIARSPADFAISSVDVELLGHSGWSQANTLGGRKQAFLASTTDFTVVRDVRLVITLRYALPRLDAKANAADQQTNLKDEVVNALFAAGPKLGTTYVVAAPTFKVEERDTRGNEQPKPGKVATITADLQCQQSGRELLAQINTI